MQYLKDIFCLLSINRSRRSFVFEVDLVFTYTPVGYSNLYFLLEQQLWSASNDHRKGELGGESAADVGGVEAYALYTSGGLLTLHIRLLVNRMRMSGGNVAGGVGGADASCGSFLMSIRPIDHLEGHEWFA